MNQVKEYRTTLGLSQLALAKQIRIARQTVNLIENNKYPSFLKYHHFSGLIFGAMMGSLAASQIASEKN